MTPGQEQQLRKLRGLEESLDPSLLVHRALTSGSMTSVIKDTLKGNPGKDGRDGINGLNGLDGRDGINGKDGIDGKDGKNGLNGIDGKNGKDGKDGKDGIVPDVNTLISKVTEEIKKTPVNFQDIKGTEQLIAFLKTGGFRGGGGGSGGGTTINFIDGEIPTGTINGINPTFTMSHSPTVDSLKVYINGLRLTNTVDYTYSGNILTMTTIPFPGDIFLLDFRY